ncbi:hypothetical protein Amet_2081 [Alkaliphilus metalliredigens QYMF]|uniref:Uncharacterized protein n=1 Tax=Alkaliphilus metalliredigens (strain QYMF) TaxID=293826 RepID=A6TPX3_ALKMQ|nr:hypothetical protein Amet_2081 [Alkaliphilus metalliredigens QYMF]
MKSHKGFFLYLKQKNRLLRDTKDFTNQDPFTDLCASQTNHNQIAL